jgi:hypothetical protein
MPNRQGQRGGLPGQMFLLTSRQLGFGPIDRWLPNQSRAEIGGFLDSSVTNHRRTNILGRPPVCGILLQRHEDVQVVAHDRETAGTRGEPLGERLQPVFAPLLAVIKCLAAKTRPLR